MEQIINNLSIEGLRELWNATLKLDDGTIHPDDTFDSVAERLPVAEIREILLEMIDMPKPPAQPRNQPRVQHVDFAEAIKDKAAQRQSRVESLRRQYYEDTYADVTGNDNVDDFYSWLKKKNAPANRKNIDDFINSIDFDSVIDFTKLNKKERELAFDRIKDKLQHLLGDFQITDNFLIHYRINGEWKTRTLTPEIWRQLLESFDNREFIYGIEDMNVPLIAFSDEPETDVFKFVYFDAISISRVRPSGNTRKDNRDSFFPYLNKTDLDLSKYQIFSSIVGENGKQIPELNDSCFVYALAQAGIDEDTLNKIRLRIHTRKFGLSKMDMICQEFNLHVSVKDLESTNDNTKFRVNRKKFFGTANGTKVLLNSYKCHYFIEDRTPYTYDYIKHKYILKEDIPNEYATKRYHQGYWSNNKDADRFMSSGKLIRLLFENNCFEPITYNNARVLSTTLYRDIKFKIDDLSYSEKHCTKLMEPRVTKSKTLNKEYTYFYADFEADVSKKPHKCFMCCLQSLDGITNRTFKGENCDRQFLEFVSQFNNPCIYFHNLKYDFSFLAKYGLKRSIQKGNRLMRAILDYTTYEDKHKEIYFRDTVPILSCKLSQLPSMFNIKGVQKEIFPYKYYTFERLESNIGTISEAGAHEDKPWTQSDYKLFNENIDKIPGCRIDDNHFNMYSYCEFYCKQDVNILRIAFNSFVSDFNKEFLINPLNFISISSLANEVFKKRVYYPNKNLYEVGGHVREFMSQAVYGGRCMCAENKKWHIKDVPIVDYDAVSLYPSAMKRLYTVEGVPEVINFEASNLTSIPQELQKYSAYIVEIRITKVGKHYPFPLIVQKTPEGNLNKDDNIDPDHPYTMVLDNIYLEDLVEFQKITFDVIRGYGWTGRKDYRIQKEIERIFLKRLEYKKQGNPLQNLYKLIMNSCYGKCIEKPVMKDASYVKDIDVTNNKETYNVYRRYIEKHYEEIVEDIDVGAGVHEIKRLRPTDNHFNNSLLGIQILSMSKRIMNEVMCLAYNLGCHIFYQDTDSMHIYKADLEKLEKEFKNKYGRELKGKMLGQFHSDFPEVKDGTPGEIPYSIESIFLMKKLYIDKLTDSSKKIDYMFRGKGLTQECIKITAKRYGGMIELYEHLYKGNEVAFDLTEGSPSFAFAKDFTVSSNEHFIRKVRTPYHEGELKI